MSRSLSGSSPFQIRIASLTRVDHQHPEANGSTTEVASLLSSSASYKNFFPASRRTKHDQLEPVTDELAFLKQEFGVERLNRIHKWLSVVGQPMPPMPLHYQKALQRHIETIIEDPACETCEVYRCALGFILSYASLISYESDLRIAKDANLVPDALEWPDWRQLVEELLTPTNKRKVNKRYVYGELRLARLNNIYRYTLDSPIRGYYYGYNSYHQFWDDNHTRIVALFAYIALVLTAMQVGLATKHLQTNNAFQRASYGFTLFSIIFPSACIGLALGFLMVLFLYNALATLNNHGRKKPVAANSA